MAIYPNIVKEMLNVCDKYRSQRMSLDYFKATILNLAKLIAAVEEKWLRDLLEKAEGELELIQFTINDDEIFEKSLVVVERIENALLKNLKMNEVEIEEAQELPTHPPLEES